jgi:hypothetical protein
MTDLRRPSGAPAAAGAPLILSILLAACGSGAGPSPTHGGPAGTPAPTATTTPAPGAIQHPTGAHDVVLRVETSGGFAPIEFLATSAPSFTLYGDGTVVFRNPSANPPDPIGNVNRSIPFQTVRLGEDAIQSLLTQAIGPGGLGIATGPYMGTGADIPSTDFTISADGRTKTVSVIGLSPGMHPQDAAIVGALSHLADLLDGFGNAIAGEQPYVPASYRGILAPIDQAPGPVVDWPWTTFGPIGFTKGPNDVVAKRTLSSADVAALKIPGAEGGFSGLTLQFSGKLYSLSLRPLLPDEAS